MDAGIYCALISAWRDKNKLVIQFQNIVVLKYSDIVKSLHCLQVILIVPDAAKIKLNTRSRSKETNESLS